MNKEQEILKKITILMCQMAESIESGEVELGYVRKSTDDIDKLIDELTQ